MVIAHIVHMIVIPLIGGLADRIGRKPVYFIGAVLAAHVGLLRLPDVRHEDSGHHPAGDLHRPGHPRLHVRIAAGDHDARCSRRACATRASRSATRSPRSSRARSRRSSRRRCCSGSTRACPVAIYLAIAAAITLVAVISLRETKGSSLHELDRHRRRAPRRGCRRRTGSRDSRSTRPWSPRCASCVSGDSSWSREPRPVQCRLWYAAASRPARSLHSVKPTEPGSSSRSNDTGD